jgi:hypothetical protein
MAKIATVAKVGGVDTTALTEALEGIQEQVSKGDAVTDKGDEVTNENNKEAAGFTVDDNVPMPDTVRTGGKPKYPWATLNEGQSFFVANGKVETFYTLCSTASKKYGHKFIARRWEEKGGVKGVRVWRSKD